MRSRLASGSRMRAMALLGLLTISISGCKTAVISDCRLLPLRAYEPAVEARIVQQMREAGPDLQRFALDAVELRDAVRACRG